VNGTIPSLSVPLCLCVFPLLAPAADEQQVRRKESVEVDRVLVDVRVIDNGGRPIRGLDAGHFRLEVDGQRAAIESVRWLDQTAAAQAAAAEARAASDAPALPDRLLMFLFQKDLNSSRGAGLVRMQRYVRDLIDRLGPHDRVAVASHDGRLRVWQDFTTDRAAVKWAVEHSVLFGRAAPQDEPAAEQPSLRRGLDSRAARDAATPEAAVKVLAEAMAPLPGTKTLILFGWGMGEMGPTGVRMTHEYQPALDALGRAGVSVFTLDLTDADYHSLEKGLQQVADDTGGTYARTHVFAATALRQLEAALAGHYVLSFERPLLPRGEHRIRLGLVGRRGTVLARTHYTDPR
jgi:VWFA-related protein